MILEPKKARQGQARPVSQKRSSKYSSSKTRRVSVCRAASVKKSGANLPVALQSVVSNTDGVLFSALACVDAGKLLASMVLVV